MSVVRLRRLQADHHQLSEYVRLHPRLQLIQADGEPPERYQLEYRIKSLRQVGSELTKVKSHMVEILLPRNYPRVPPVCRMLTPVFHPNIAPHAICIGDHWSAGEPLTSIVARIGEMLAYQSYNVKSPLNGEAARWVDENLDELPLDAVSMVVELEAVPPAPPAEAPAPVGDTVPPEDSMYRIQERRPQVRATSVDDTGPPPADIRFSCESCGAKMKASARKAGTRGQCPQCHAPITVPHV